MSVLLEGSGLIEWQAAEAVGYLGAYQQVALRQLRERMIALMTRLPERERHIIRAHYLQEMPFRDIAAEMALSKGRVSQLHKAALELLRQELIRAKFCRPTSYDMQRYCSASGAARGCLRKDDGEN